MPMSMQRDRQSRIWPMRSWRAIPRRAFITRLLALGLTPAVAGSVLAMCTRTDVRCAAQSSVPPDVSGDIRFMIGPWTDKEVEHHETIAAAFKELYPNVNFSFKLYSWDTADDGSRRVAGRRRPRHLLLRRRRLPRPRRTGERLRGPHSPHQRPSLRRGEGQVPLLGPHRGLRPEADGPAASAGMSRTPSSSTWTWSSAAGFDETFVEDWDTFVDA